jgi:hypothetical protein
MFLLKKAKVLFAFLVRKVSSTSDCTQLQEDLDNSIKWEQQWQMQFNPDKCEVLTITKKRKPLHHDCALMFLWVGGSQTAAAYSIVGWTKVVNARSLTDWGQVPMFLLKKAKVLFAFLVRKVSSTSDCTQLQEDLDNLIKWEQQWQMQFNPDKCEVC